jgi:hypothetical protein
MSFSLRRSALALFKDKVAQMAAGSQPMTVICKIKQMIPVRILPLTMKDRKGSRIASSMILSFDDIFYWVF